MMPEQPSLPGQEAQNSLIADLADVFVRSVITQR
jgi:hypothetical protein